MKREIYRSLLAWKESQRRKPLMLYGARQVGKTFTLKEFGKNEYKNLVYINCYRNEAVKTLFDDGVDVSRLLIGLSAISGESIIPGETLIFLDEVQEIPAVVASLKYFCEDAPEIHIAVAGSLLGVMNMEGVSFPTGKVEILRMFPMTFIEFLEAKGESQKVDLLRSDQESVTNALSKDYVDLLRQYYFVGGMPEVVLDFITNNNPLSVRKIQLDIITAYEADIAKHVGPETQKARMIFQSIPSQLAKENKKFIFGALRKGARAAEYEKALQWLVDAFLVYKVERVSKVAIPLNFYLNDSGFKLFLLDVGLLGAMANVPSPLMLIGNDIFSEFKGAFTENYAIEQMVPLPNLTITYYSKENSTMELDFVVQIGTEILPIEVKAEHNVKSKSLRQFVCVDNAGSGMQGIRFSMLGFSRQDWLENVPLYAIGSFLGKRCN